MPKSLLSGDGDAFMDFLEAEYQFALSVIAKIDSDIRKTAKELKASQEVVLGPFMTSVFYDRVPDRSV